MKVKNACSIACISSILLGFSMFSQNVSSAEIYKNNLSSMLSNRKAVIYALIIRTFNASDKNGDRLIEPEKGEVTGNFLNAIKRLDELKSLNINTIHMLPINKLGKTQALGTAGSVYSPVSFNEIEPSLDDKTNPMSVEEEAKLFVKECHKRNIKVMLDLPSCANIELFSQQPQLFLKDKNNNPLIPLDWKDVRLFKVYSDESTKKLNYDLIKLHKDFVDMCLKLGIDGIRADVAALKPPAFWSEIISYARQKDPQFGFLAESSDSWLGDISPELHSTPPEKLLSSGFDAYYGSYFKVDEWKTASEFFNQISYNKKMLNSFKTKKAAIGSFATHDEESPIYTLGVKLSKQIIIFNSTLPEINPYFISGFETGDNYLYPYANKAADSSRTDCNTYFVHNAKLDIFNLSDKPHGANPELQQEIKKALAFRVQHENLIIKGSFKQITPLNNNSDQVIAYIREYGQEKLLVIANSDFKKSQNVELELGKDLINNYFTTYPLVSANSMSLFPDNSRLIANLKPGDIYLIMYHK
ncbi:MAG: alpha-glucosidase C-terminal domain-containing protein [bacterium]